MKILKKYPGWFNFAINFRKALDDNLELTEEFMEENVTSVKEFSQAL